MGIYVQYRIGNNYTSTTIDADYFEYPRTNEETFVRILKKNPEGNWIEMAIFNKNDVIGLYLCEDNTSTITPKKHKK